MDAPGHMSSVSSPKSGTVSDVATAHPVDRVAIPHTRHTDKDVTMGYDERVSIVSGVDILIGLARFTQVV